LTVRLQAEVGGAHAARPTQVSQPPGIELRQLACEHGFARIDGVSTTRGVEHRGDQRFPRGRGREQVAACVVIVAAAPVRRQQRAADAFQVAARVVARPAGSEAVADMPVGIALQVGEQQFVSGRLRPREAERADPAEVDLDVVAIVVRRWRLEARTPDRHRYAP
jgi:hypothetical protein